MMLLFAFALQNPVSVVDRIPFSEQRGDSCDPEATARQILQGKKVPRNVLFHYGKREVLMGDVMAKTVPAQAWDDFIMGEKTRFHLKRFRRGLYGTERLESADSFGNKSFNWLIEIRLKESCLVSQRIATISGISKSTLFRDWYESKGFSNELKDWKSKCFLRSGKPDPQQYSFYGKEKFLMKESAFRETECESVIADFYEQNNIALVQDDAGDLTLSWALRDRECIENVMGSSSYWVKQFSVREELWENQCPIKKTRNHRNNIRVWFSAMSDSGYSSRELDQFAEMIAKVKQPEDVRDWQTDEVDRFAAQDFATTLSRVGLRCEKSGKKYKFQEVLGGIASNVDDLQSEDVKITLESACR